MTFRWLTELRGLVLGRPGGKSSPWGGVDLHQPSLLRSHVSFYRLRTLAGFNGPYSRPAPA